jgi:hypothetical protein
MSTEINSAKARSSRRNFQKQERALRATCLLCRILWPIVVQHRHFLFDYSSEAKTILLTQRRAR